MSGESSISLAWQFCGRMKLPEGFKEADGSLAIYARFAKAFYRWAVNNHSFKRRATY